VSSAKVYLLVAIFIGLSTSFSFAYHPYRTEDAGTTPQGGIGLQLENEFSTDDSGKQNVTTFTLVYGVLDWIEVDIILALLNLRPDSGQNEFGFGDVVLLTKIKVLGENGYFGKSEYLPEIVLEPSVLIPTGDEDKGLGTGQIQVGMLLALEKHFWKLTGRANIGYLASNDPTFDQNFENRFFYGVQVDFPLFIERLRLGTELTGEFGENTGASLFSLTGFIFQITDNIVLDAGVELGLRDAASTVVAIAGISFGYNPFEEFFNNK
jgi:hypothetical protein